ncbi:O-antigen ligase family protein [Myxacorys almedinensis]|uniref:O-antigen ligase-related domain-containing protein n=1 Tax=Myxacorys almedinensis A TaxID=2690445 RepID=A0A8J7Z3P8_9CYAN|nr:O-antigen ligase family protein [Myxacorys almedinensis]NDJ18730.1 hypothetical protein [Myxacorys almedinensis A]
MKPKSKWSAILLGAYVHGLTLYFTLSSLVGVRSNVLTGIFQVALISIPFLFIITDKKPKQNLFRIGVIDILYIAFVAMFLYDLIFPSPTTVFPENLAIYFSVYWFALVLARSLTFSQFKVFCYASNATASVTSLVLFAQVMSGSAMLVDNGNRLAAGSSGNPILVGYTGAFAFLSGLILWITGKTSTRAIWLLISIPGFFVCTLSGTRSATLSMLASAFLLGVYVLYILLSSNKASSTFFANTVLAAGIFLSGLIILDPVMAIMSPEKRSDEPSLLASAIENGISRIDILFRVASGGRGDMSIDGRQAIYQYAWELFLKNPIWGNGLYSSGSAHNAFLQVATEFGVFGILTFTVPLLCLSYQFFKVIGLSMVQLDQRRSLRHPLRLLKSDYATMTGFSIIFFIQALCLFSFHGDPYRNYLPLCSIGVLIAFVRLSKREIQENLQSS